MEACVFGWQAGATAAGELSQPEEFSSCQNNFPALSPVDQQAAVKHLRRLMWKNASLVRDRSGLEEILRYLEDGKSDCSEGPSWEGEEIKSMATVAEAVVRSALLRRESRGAHYRRDFPDTDPLYEGNVICRQHGNELTVSFERLQTETQ